MAKFISGRVKRRDQSQLSDNRYRYLSLDEAEPNLGDTPNDLGTPGLPAGQQFIVVGFKDRPGERFWVPKEGGIIPGSISIFDEGTLVGALSSITQLDFIGNSVIASSNTLVETTLTLKNNETFSFSENLLVTQSGNTASGVVKFPTVNSGIVTLTNVSGSFNGTGELLQSSVAIGKTPTGIGTVVTTSGVAADITIAPPGNNNSVLFKNNGDFDTDDRFTFTDGLFTAGDRITVGTGGTVITTLNSGFVGIGTTNPKRELHLIGNFRLNGTIYDTNNNSGSQGQLLLKGTSGLVWSNQSAISAGAGGDIGQIQFHNSAGVLGGSDNIYYDPQNERIGIGTSSPSQLLDVVGVSTFNGEVFIKTLTVGANADFNFNVNITNNLDVDGNTELDALNVDGHTELDTLNVSVATTTSKLNVTGHSNFNTLEVSGISTFDGLLDINAGFEANTLRLEDLTNNRVVIVGVNGEVEDDPNLTFDGSLLNIGVGLSVSGTTTLNDLNVTGVATVSDLDFSGGLSLNSLTVSGISTLGNIVADGNTLKTVSGNLIIDSATNTTAIKDVIFQDIDTDSTSTSTGSFVTLGGVGIAKNLNVGNNVSIAGTTVGVAVTLASNGGITTTGGDLFVGNDLTIKGDLSFDELEARRGVFTEYLQTLGFKATGVSTFTNDIFAESTLTVGPSLGDASYPTDQGTLAVYSSGGKNALIIQTLDNSNSRGIAFRNSGDSYTGFISMENRGNNSADMVFGVDDVNETGIDDVTERLRITKEGNVGIGTSNVQANLHIESATPGIRLADTDNSGAYALFDANAANAIIHADKDNQVNNSRVAFAVDNDEKVRIDSNGDVGIGIKEGINSRLHVKGGSESTDNLLLTLQSNGVANDGSLSTGLRLINSTSDTSIHGADIRAIRTGVSTSALTFSLYDGALTEKLRITSDGNIGIGTDNPVTKLDVNGNIFPSFTDTHNIGSSTKRWNKIFAKNIDLEGNIDITGDIVINDLFVSGISTLTGEVSFGSTATFGDNDKLKFGDSGDLQIYHDDSNSYVQDAGTGNLILSGTRVNLLNPAANETMVSAQADGPVELYYDNSKKFETTGIGVSVTGSIEGYDDLRSPFDSTARTIVVTVAAKTSNHRYSGTGSGNGYLLDGIESPFLTLTPGRTYKFDQSDSSNSGHPLRFYLEGDKTTQYSTGITNSGTPGNSGAYVQIVVSDETPIVLHYQCSAHAYMGNALQSNSNVVNTNYQATIRNNLSITPSSDVDGLVIDSTSASTEDNPHIKLKGNGPQVIDFRDTSDGDGIRISYRTTPNQWRLEKSETDGYIYFLADRDDGRLELNHDNHKKLETTGAGVTITGIGTAATFHATGGTFSTGINTATDAAIIIDEETSIYTKDGSYLRNLIQKKSDVIIIGQHNTSLIDGIELKPGGNNDGPVKLHHGGTTDNVKFETTGVGVTITGIVDLNGTTITGTATGTISTTSEVGIHTLSKNDFRSVEYFIQATRGTDYHSNKVLVVHDGTNASNSEYGTIFTDTRLVTFSSDIDGNNLRLKAKGTSASQTEYKIHFTAIRV